MLTNCHCQALDLLPSVCFPAQHNPGWLVLDIIPSPSLYCAWQVGYHSLSLLILCLAGMISFIVPPYIGPGR